MTQVGASRIRHVRHPEERPQAASRRTHYTSTCSDHAPCRFQPDRGRARKASDLGQATVQPMTPSFLTRALARQFAAFCAVGLVAATVHYGLLISLVEGYRLDAVRATLCGYAAGGIVSYLLNRRHTHVSDRPHAQAGWRLLLGARA